MKDIHKKRKPAFRIRKLEDGKWWFDPKEITGSDELCGGYDTEAECREAARSLRDNGSQNFTRDQVCTGSK